MSKGCPRRAARRRRCRVRGRALQARSTRKPSSKVLSVPVSAPTSGPAARRAFFMSSPGRRRRWPCRPTRRRAGAAGPRFDAVEAALRGDVGALRRPSGAIVRGQLDLQRLARRPSSCGREPRAAPAASAGRRRRPTWRRRRRPRRARCTRRARRGRARRAPATCPACGPRRRARARACPPGTPSVTLVGPRVDLAPASRSRSRRGARSTPRARVLARRASATRCATRRRRATSAPTPPPCPPAGLARHVASAASTVLHRPVRVELGAAHGHRVRAAGRSSSTSISGACACAPGTRPPSRCTPRRRKPAASICASSMVERDAVRRGLVDALAPHVPGQHPRTTAAAGAAQHREQHDERGRASARAPAPGRSPSLARRRPAAAPGPSRSEARAGAEEPGRCAGPALARWSPGAAGAARSAWSRRPWYPRDTLGAMRAIVVTRSVDLASPPERVWPLLADTERFNRLIGAHDVHYRPIEEGTTSSARFVAETRAGGFKLVYEEFPFEWSHQRTFGVHRRMRGGPVESYTWRVLARADARDRRRRARSRAGRARRCAWRSRRGRALLRADRVDQREALHGEVRRARRAHRRARPRGRGEPVRQARVPPSDRARIDVGRAAAEGRRRRRRRSPTSWARSCARAPTRTSCACGRSRSPTSGAATGATCCARSSRPSRRGWSSCAGASSARAA